MACAWGSKVNGILTVVTIGIAVLIDLWDILDIKKGYTLVRTSYRYAHHPFIRSAGALLEALPGSCYWVDRDTFYHLPLILLCSLCRPHSFGSGRHLHESCFPGDPYWQRVADAQSR